MKMCEFISWIKKDEKIYYLTRTQIDSPQGEALKKRFSGEGELLGHAAIRAYYDIDYGTEIECIECTDFSYPDNFPDVIVKAIKNGEFRNMAYPGGLLDTKAFAHIPNAVKAVADRVKAVADWKKADADTEKTVADRVKAVADWEKAVSPFFWDLFANPENRTTRWK